MIVKIILLFARWVLFVIFRVNINCLVSWTAATRNPSSRYWRSTSPGYASCGVRVPTPRPKSLTSWRTGAPSQTPQMPWPWRAAPKPTSCPGNIIPHCRLGSVQTERNRTYVRAKTMRLEKWLNDFFTNIYHVDFTKIYHVDKIQRECSLWFESVNIP